MGVALAPAITSATTIKQVKLVLVPLGLFDVNVTVAIVFAVTAAAAVVVVTNGSSLGVDYFFFLSFRLVVLSARRDKTPRGIEKVCGCLLDSSFARSYATGRQTCFIFVCPCGS